MTRIVSPLEVFSPRSRKDFELDAGTLEPLRGVVAVPDRARVGNYLRSGVLILALMEYTRDVIGSKFGVSGGSAFMTDGTYYWRFDAADYVEPYGLAIDDGAIAGMRSRDWRAPRLRASEVAAIDVYLYQVLRGESI